MTCYSSPLFLLFYMCGGQREQSATCLVKNIIIHNLHRGQFSIIFPILLPIILLFAHFSGIIFLIPWPTYYSQNYSRIISASLAGDTVPTVLQHSLYASALRETHHPPPLCTCFLGVAKKTILNGNFPRKFSQSWVMPIDVIRN